MDNVEKLIREVKASRVDGVWNEMVIPMAEIIRIQHEALKNAKELGCCLADCMETIDETNRIAGEIIGE